MAIGEDIGNAEGAGYLILAFVVLGAVGFILYEVFELGNTTATAVGNLLNSFGINTSSGGMNQPSAVPGQSTVAQSVGCADQPNTDSSGQTDYSGASGYTTVCN